MKNNNLLLLHEAIVVALVDKVSFPNRIGTFEAIANYIEGRKLFKGGDGLTLREQVRLRSTVANKKGYAYLFEEIDENTIRLRNI